MRLIHGIKKNMKKVLILFRSSHPLLSGADNMAIYTAKYLARFSEFEITLVQKSDVYSEKYVYEDQMVKRIFIPTNSFSKDYLSLFNELQPNIVHLIDLVDEEFCDMALALAEDFPLILTPATDISMWGNEKKAIDLCYLAQKIITLTSHEEDLIVEKLGGDYSKRITRVPQAPILSDSKGFNFRDRYNIKEEDPIILFLGRKLKSKGYHILLESSKLVKSKYPNSKFVFIGPHQLDSRDIFADYINDEAIIDLEQVSEVEKLSALRACNLLCLPSTVDVFPLTFLEAWACKKPIISASFPGVDQIIQHRLNGLITEATVCGISENIEFLLGHEKTARKYGENGYEKVINHYSWEKVADNMASIYKEVIKKEGTIL
ncbi:hypothetical protein COK37_22245 [Bacillus thuringiensis]|uniref:glycosyltransferase family 4 protein n=2 Tax=Bacillus thuringiensis TaxID=1428 RepID=UPI000BF8F418|nr:glycosyltransferase family 4 protein [Bacillus thuringiensis]PEV42897.1 hypothetical protein CN432_23220 [Bacillus thuringiensis]PFR65588.1 hypothetical protein COK37_22245 [Bacillus thuringiensis]PFT74919.1 hypothetical protein COK70_27365 [Bacillus thuringiensis]PFV82424.1 hypothetical protein COL06_28890 [Bacillus thuringiensis]